MSAGLDAPVAGQGGGRRRPILGIAMALVLGFALLAVLAFRGPLRPVVARRLATFIWGPVMLAVSQSSLDDQEHARIVGHLEAVKRGFDAGRLSAEQLYAVSYALSRRSLVALLRFEGVLREHLGPMKLEPAERLEVTRQFRRFARAVLDGKVDRRRVRPLYEVYREHGRKDSPHELSIGELRAMAARFAAFADEVGVADTVPRADYPAVFQAEIRTALDGA